MLDAANTKGMLVLELLSVAEPLLVTVATLDGSACGRTCVLLLAEGLRLIRIEALGVLVLQDERVFTGVALGLLVIPLVGEEELVDVSVRLFPLLTDWVAVPDSLIVPLALPEAEAELVIERVPLTVTEEEPEVVVERVPFTLDEEEADPVDERVALEEADELMEELPLAVPVELLDCRTEAVSVPLTKGLLDRTPEDVGVIEGPIDLVRRELRVSGDEAE